MSNTSEALKMDDGRFGRWIRDVFSRKSSEATLKDALEEVIEERADEEAWLSSQEKAMLRNLLVVGELRVRDVMIPRAGIVAVPYTISLPELKKVVIEKRHSRLPVYDGTLDKLKGFLHIKDLMPALSGDEPFVIDHVLRDVLFVSPSMRLVDLLVQMRLSGDHLAIVVDEYGGADGLVTMEDLFEEIVGEIQDEHDEEGPEFLLKKVGPNAYEADARIPVEQVETELGLRLPRDEQEYDTLGGLIFSKLGRVPARGEVIEISPVGRLEIIEADPRRIRRVRLQLKKLLARD